MILKSIKKIVRDAFDAAGLLPQVRHIQERVERELFTRHQNRLTPEQIAAIYRVEYHNKSHYGEFNNDNSGWEPDSIIKLAHARAICQVLPHIKKVLVGGCSSGMGVLAFRRLGVDAWGFDVSPDLETMVLPDVKMYIRQGSMTNIPFVERDGFDCFLTTDVLEHVQLKDIKYAVEEMRRLNCSWMVHLINHHSIQPDHMTLKPLKWWAKRMYPYYRLRSDLYTMECKNPRIYGLNGDPLHVYTFWERRI